MIAKKKHKKSETKAKARAIKEATRFNIIVDYIINHITQRQLAAKYKISIATINKFLKPNYVKSVIDKMLANSSISKKDSEKIQTWVNFSMEGQQKKESQSKSTEQEKIIDSAVNKVQEKQIEILGILERSSEATAIGLNNVIARLTMALQPTEDDNGKKIYPSIDTVLDISAELRELFKTTSRFNSTLTQPEQPLIQNNIQVNMANMFAELMKTDPVAKNVLPIRAIENPKQNETPTQYDPPVQVIDFKERAKLPPAGEALLENGKRDQLEEPPESDYNSDNVVELLSGL